LPVIVTYSFPTTAPGYLGAIAGFTAASVASFQAFTQTMKAQARAALGQWSAACGLVFLEVAPGQGDINFQLVDFNSTTGPSYAGSGGIAFYPFGNWNFFTYPHFTTSLDASGDVFMNTRFVSGSGIGAQVNAGTLLHEIGHAIGLKHPTEIVYNGASGANHDQVLAADDPSLTIMATVGDGSAIAATLKPLDQAAAAALYGPAGLGGTYTTSATGANSVSAWAFDAFTQTVTQTGYATADAIRGTSLADSILGGEGADTLMGLAGNDTLNGGSGNDRLYGGQGINLLIGRQGDDFYLLENPTNTITENLNEGTDRVVVGFSYTLSANVENLQLIGTNLIGTGNASANTIYGDGVGANILYGLAGDDYLVGGSANDVIDGGSEADQMYGGKGNDNYFVDNPGDIVGEELGEGSDSIISIVPYILSTNIENPTLGGSAIINATGNDLDNVLTGNAQANKISGGSGSDSMVGGTGNDIYVVDSPMDSILEAAGEGTDLVQSSITCSLAGLLNVEQLTLTGSSAINGTGNALANILSGNAGANVLDGGDGNDTLSGSSGNDTLIGGFGNDRLTGGANNDRFVFGAELNDGLADTDTITDLSSGNDLIQVGISGGSFAANIVSLGSNKYAIDWDGVGIGSPSQDSIQINVALTTANFVFL
jgi:Ca2+-binding RTX toxin-like protein